jgi:hypothetical protein
MQVDARACRLDTGEHHRGRTSDKWNDGRQALRLGHDASLELAGAQHSLSPVMSGGGAVIAPVCTFGGLKRELIRDVAGLY